jgi:5-methylcytosine-specific restriction endonuclease McrA
MAQVKETWTDDLGRVWPVLRPGKLKPTLHVSHAALRRFVFIRDGFTCAICGAKAVKTPVDYDGWETVWVDRKCDSGSICFMHVDHVVARCNGGSNHPSNLRALCESCNARKAGR